MLNIGECPLSGQEILGEFPNIDTGVFRKKATVQKGEIKNLAKPALGKEA